VGPRDPARMFKTEGRRVHGAFVVRYELDRCIGTIRLICTRILDLQFLQTLTPKPAEIGPRGEP